MNDPFSKHHYATTQLKIEIGRVREAARKQSEIVIEKKAAMLAATEAWRREEDVLIIQGRKIDALTVSLGLLYHDEVQPPHTAGGDK